MSGPPGGLHSRAPANRVGGQRRRLTRPVPRPPAGVPRSATLPVLNVESTTAASTPFAGGAVGYDSTLNAEEGGTGTTYFTYQEGATSPEISQSMLHFPPPAGVPVDHNHKPSQGGGTGRDEVSPTPTTTSNNSANTLTTDGGKKTAEAKKKHGGLAISNPFRSSSRQNLEQTPLPPATPTKAAKLLGVNTNTETEQDGRPRTAQSHGSVQEFRPRTAKNDNSALDGVDEQEHRGRRELPQQHSMPFLGSPYSASGNDPFDDLIVESDDDDDHDRKGSKSKSLLQSSKKMARKMSVVNLSNFFTARNEKPSPIVTSASPCHASFRHELSANQLGDSYAHVSTEQRSPERAQPSIAPRTTSSHSENGYGKKKKSRGSRKQRSQVDRMAPLTEASRDDMRAAYLDGEDDTWVDVVPEYARDSVASGGPVRPPRNESLASSSIGPYGLSTDELSAGNDDTDEYEDEDETPLLAKDKGKSVKKDEFQAQQPSAFHLRSPLQNVEDHLLDVSERYLESMRLSGAGEKRSPGEHRAANESPSESSTVTQSSTAYRNGETQASEEIWTAPSETVVDALELLRKNAEAEKMLLDYKIAQLKASHDKMKENFAPYAAKDKKKASENGQKEGSASIRNSIDLDEEPTVHTARAMPMMRITAGMVKLVDIPPRKKTTT